VIGFPAGKIGRSRTASLEARDPEEQQDRSHSHHQQESEHKMASFGATPFTSGMHVEYDWNGGTGDAPYWCEAVVVNVNPNGTYTIVLVENRVLLELVSTDDELRVGTTVSYNWRNSDTFYDYTVAKINEDDKVNLEMRQEEVEQIHLRPRANTEVFAVGEATIYCWGGGDSWFDCVIQAVNPADGTYDVLMVDCDVPLALLAHPTGQPRGVEPRTNPVLPHSLQEGSVVDYNW